MKARRNTSRASVLQVLALLASICLLGLALAGYAVYRTITVGSDLRAVRNVVTRDLRLDYSRKVEISARPWLVSIARFGLSFAPMDDEAKLALNAVRGAEVGVYELESKPDFGERRELFGKIDDRMNRRHWARSVAVLGEDGLVLVYLPDGDAATADALEVFVCVLNDRDLVLVSGKADLEPIIDLMQPELRNGLPVDWRL